MCSYTNVSISSEETTNLAEAIVATADLVEGGLEQMAADIKKLEAGIFLQMADSGSTSAIPTFSGDSEERAYMKNIIVIFVLLLDHLFKVTHPELKFREMTISPKKGRRMMSSCTKFKKFFWQMKSKETGESAEFFFWRIRSQYFSSAWSHLTTKRLKLKTGMFCNLSGGVCCFNTARLKLIAFGVPGTGPSTCSLRYP